MKKNIMSRVEFARRRGVSAKTVAIWL
jgi:hypothetical protein